MQKIAEGKYDKWLTEQGMSPIPEELKAKMRGWVDKYRKSLDEIVVEATKPVVAPHLHST